MKKVYLVFGLFFMLFACAPSTYFQLLETDTSQSTVKDKEFFYENDNLIISYELWGNKGNASFKIFNKTDKDIFIDLKRSHLIVNDIAYTYYQNRKFSVKPIPVLSAATDEQLEELRKVKLPGVLMKNLPVQSNEAVEFLEERIVCIPPKSAQIVNGFSLINSIYRDCVLYRFPSSKQEFYVEFKKDNTPFSFRNRISYAFDENFKDLKIFENDFFVNKISNFTETNFIKYEKLSFCNDSSNIEIQMSPFYKPSSFFIKYKLEPGRINH